MLNETVAPNLIFTLDDSTSMNRAFVPDVAGTNNQQDRNDIRPTRRAKSATFNPMYYNPKTIYRIPNTLTKSGQESTLDTQFDKAFMDGFNPEKNNGNDWVNLSNSYRPAWTYNKSSNGQGNYDTNSNAALNSILAQHPTSDFSRTEIITTNNTTRTYTTPEGVIFTFNRLNRDSNFTCSVTFPSLSAQNITCTRSSNSYTANLTQAAVPAYYYRYDPTLSSCTLNSINNDDCYKLTFVSSTSGTAIKSDGSILTDERKNFAIWYSFYRTRSLATLSSASIAFYNLSSSSRLTWQSLIHCKNPNSSAGGDCGANQFRTYNTQQKANFLDWLQRSTRFNLASGTPLRSAVERAGNFLTGSIAWEKEPGSTGNTAANTYSCRPSYHIVMTDGMWTNTGETISNPSRNDSANFILPDGKNYTGNIAPFSDSTQATLADIAMHYWATDLRPNTQLKNELKPYIPFKSDNENTQYWDPRNNPATWQHMVNFMMGLGLSESLNRAGLPWEGGTFKGSGYEALKNGATWPQAGSGEQANVYDLWHAAINSRGEFFSVESPEDMVAAFEDILNRIADRTTTAARPAVSASFVSDSNGSDLQSNVYATQFSSEDWSGQLSKTLVSANDQTTELWNIQTANQSLDPLTRRVMMAAPSNNSTGLKDFTWANLGTLQSLLNIDPDSLVGAQDNRGEQRVAYIRGERSGEGDTTPKFRKRNNRTVMGDIINSSPVIVGTPAYLAYLADAIENPLGNRASYKSYAAFRETYQKSSVNNPDGRPEMIYVGGNDGMLHGFNAATGREEFAFIPTEVIKNLYRLTGQNYSGAGHRYFVDGSPIVRDVYFGDDEGWRTVLIGTLRAGGKSLFALDVTDPTQIKLLWEFDSAKDADLGFTFAQPEIVRLHTGEWAVLQGNGYNSTNDKAALLIINIKSGELIKKITVPDVVEGSITLSNGLSSVRGADNNGDGLVDYAYAGDLQGNLWRFDLVRSLPDNSPAPDEFLVDGVPFRSNDPFSRRRPDVSATSVADFKLAYGEKPLFVATDEAGKRQAITIQPSLVRHPTSYGYLVLFGTGKYLETSDANVDTSRAMTLYGIWDRNTKRQATSSSTLRPETRERLQEQEFTQQEDNESFKNAEGEVTATRDIRLLSDKVPEWYKEPESGQQIDTTKDENVNKWGWALNMSVSKELTGEMIVNNMTASGSILFLSSLTPNQDPCQAGAETWLYAVDAFTGGRTRFNVLDLNADRLVNPTDEYNANVVSGVRFPALGGFTLAPGGKALGSDGAENPLGVGPDPNSSGRQSWHIVPEEFQ
ncbi:pilus assembly protein PilY [Ectopseudomonas mendocina]|nr:pilus assembly protein PilY [Pseudomonas mendocina]TRO23966.1 pilus assembly protein PilY [Pseudomonas mendocina]